MRYTRRTAAAPVLFMIVVAVIAGVVLRGAGLLLVAHGSSPLPGPASRPVAKLVLKAIDANPMLLSPAKMASLYDYVTLTPGNAVFARQIKSANPNVKVLVYQTPHLIHTWEETWGTVNGHESWFMHNGSGRRTANDPENFVMDIRNPEFRAYEIRHIVNLVNTYGFDGIFWDGPPGTLALLTLNPGPDPAAVQTWHQDILKYLKQFREALGSKWIITNSTQTFDTGLSGADDADYLQYVDGTEIEGFGHAPWYGATVTPSDWGWQQRMVQRNIAAGKIMHALGGVDLQQASPAQVHQWQLFTYGSALLWADGVHVYYQWAPWGTKAAGIIFPEMTVPIGTPLGAAYSSGGVTQRDFSGGKILVNASDRARQIELPSPLRPLGGAPVTTVALRPWTATLLLK